MAAAAAAGSADPGLPPLPPHTLRVHWRVAGDPARARGYGLHVWGDGVQRPTEWAKPLQPVAVGPAVGGAVFDVPLRGQGEQGAGAGAGAGEGAGGAAAAASWAGVLVHRPPARAGLPHEEAVGVERLDLSAGTREVWLVGEAGGAAGGGGGGGGGGSGESGESGAAAVVFTEPPDLSDVAPGSLSRARAHWVSPDTLLWRVPATEGGGAGPGARRRFFLHASAAAALRLTGRGGVVGADATFELLLAPPAPAPPAGGGSGAPRFSPATARFPHLFGCTELRLPPEAVAEAGALLRCQLAVSVRAPGADGPSDGGGGSGGGGGVGGNGGALLDATGVQTAGALDGLFATDWPLGDWADPHTGLRTLSVWAPTAQRVELLHWGRGPDYSLDPATGEPRSSADARRAARSAPPSRVLDMVRGPDGGPQAGVWSVPRPLEWTGTAYKLRVTAFHPATGAVEAAEATEPYARALTADGERCVFCDLGAPGMAPPGWDGHAVPGLAQWTDVSVYELHIRDFRCAAFPVLVF